MEISLQIIFEKLNMRADETVLNTSVQSVFRDVRLLSPELSVLKSGILYVGECDHLNELVYESGCGLCLLNGSGSFPCDTLFVQNRQSCFELFNRISQIFYAIRTQFEKLTQAILQKKGLQQVVEIVSEICDNPVYLVDSSFKVLGIHGPDTMPEMSAIWRRLLNDGYLPYNVVMNLIESNELQTMESGLCAELILSNFFYTPFINYNMRYKGKIQGHFFVVGMLNSITPGDVELTNLVGPYVLDAIRSDPRFQTTRGRYYEHFIIDMLKGKLIQTAHIKSQVKALRLDLNDFYTVIIIKPDLIDELRNEQISLQLENIKGCKPVYFNNAIVAVFPKIQQKQPSLIKKLKTLSASINGTIGVSDEIQGFGNLHHLYIQASAAITLGQQMALPSTIYRYQDVMRYHPFLGFGNKDDLEAMCHPGILILHAHDAKHHTKFIQTLEIYLKHERHSLPTAAALHIHRNTLTYRLEKIDNLFNFNLDDVSERERIMLTLNIFAYCEKTSFTPVEGIVDAD
ncbi:MAG: helix-turn-helix domain-containing protein [Eubacteriaceae bacterium]|nr:helix-turn-helix domain-containing protein [Eubacteriaceae bacterium]